MVSLRKLPKFNSFDQLKEWITSTGKFRKSLPLGHIYYCPQLEEKDYIEIWYYQTPVVTWYRDKIILNTGGWYTATTKSRMNTFLPTGYRVYQKHFYWWINTPTGKVPFLTNTLELPYVSSET